MEVTHSRCGEDGTNKEGIVNIGGSSGDEEVRFNS